MFKLGNIMVDRILDGTALDSNHKILYVIDQFQDATIEISAESKDVKDAQGTLVRRFWQAKSGTFTATNAMLNTDIMAAVTGTDKVNAAAGEGAITAPKIVKVKAGETPTFADYKKDIANMSVSAIGKNGGTGKSYTLGTTASETEYAITTEGKFTPPTDADEKEFVVVYNRSVESGIVIRNRSDKFPGTVEFLLRALYADPCDKDALKLCYIRIPSLQVSPETSVALKTDTTLDYKGDLQVDYCSDDKTLYEIYFAEDDEYDN